MNLFAKVLLFFCSSAPLFSAANTPSITLVANAEGENTAIAPNTWTEIKGQNLSNTGDTRIWQGSDFAGGQMPTKLDGVGVTLNGKSAFVYYISPTQINILTPPDTMPAAVAVVVTTSAGVSAAYTAPAKSISPSFFVFNGGPYVAATHSDGSFLGPAALYSGLTTPAKPGETIVLYANGFGQTSVPIVSGSNTQSGTLDTLPGITIGGIAATVQFAGLVAPGEFQFNVVVPANVPNGDNALIAIYEGAEASPAAEITIQGSGSAPTAITFYVAPDGSDTWSGRIAAPNAIASDGPFATFDRARAVVASIAKTGLTEIDVQFRAGTYYLAVTEMLSASDSGTATMQIVYENYPGETPVFSGGVRVRNWTNSGGNSWKATLPASTQYFENLFYNGTRRLRPRLGGTLLGAFYRIANTIYLNAPGPPAAAPHPNCPVYITGSGWECFDRFKYASTDPISSAWNNLAPPAGNLCGQPAGNQAIAGDIEVLVFEQFSTSKLRVACVDAKNQIAYMTGPTGISQSNSTEAGFIAGNRYLVENVQNALVLPGQWFLDRSTTPWTLTYLASSGENPSTDLIIVPQLTQVLVASNLQYVTFRGITFEHDNYTLPATGHVSSELEPDISSAVSFQNSSHITFDSGIVTQTSGSGLEMISCLNSVSPAYCASTNLNAVVTNNVVENSAFYDIGVLGIRIGNPFQGADTDANVPQLTTVQNNVIEGYGRVIPAAFGIGQGMGHDNLYTHNDVYDGYHCAISTSQSINVTTVPGGIGNANNVISFNHVYNLLQGIMNDGGALRIDGGNAVFTAAGNKILNNRIHDVADASIQDSNGYGGHGIYMDDHTGLVDVENNLVYRVSGAAIYTPHGPIRQNEANIIRNNILAFARMSIVEEGDPYQDYSPFAANRSFVLSNNLVYFDRSIASTPNFYVQGGCSYSLGADYTSFMLFSSNLYWRTDGGFATDTKAFHVQSTAGLGPNAPCSQTLSTWTFYTFSGWQTIVGEDVLSVVQNPGFNDPSYPADDYTLPKGSPGVGFVVFDYTQAGRSSPIFIPPAIAATFPTKIFNPATDY